MNTMAGKTKAKRDPEVELRFKSEEEEVRFWESISDEELLAITEEVPEEEIHIDACVKEEVRERAQAKQLISLRIEKQQLRSAKEIARKKGMPYQALIRRWIDEGIKRELHKESDYSLVSSPSLVVQYKVEQWKGKLVMQILQTDFSFVQQSLFSSIKDYALYASSSHKTRSADREGNLYD